MIEVRGKSETWGVIVPDEQAEAMLQDGIAGHRIENTIPAWIAGLGLARPWVALQDLWNWPSRWGRK